jgi:hypothetical protein
MAYSMDFGFDGKNIMSDAEGNLTYQGTKTPITKADYEALVKEFTGFVFENGKFVDDRGNLDANYKAWLEIAKAKQTAAMKEAGYNPDHAYYEPYDPSKKY